MHRPKLVRLVFLSAGAASILLAASAAVAQVSGVWDLQWNAVSGGGGASAADPYSVTGTIGQAVAGGPATGGDYAVISGFGAALGDIKYRLILPQLSREP